MNKRVNWYDFKRVTADDMNVEQAAWLAASDHAQLSLAGSGVVQNFGLQPVVFDSSQLTTTQNGWVVANSFDGRGILATAYASSDSVYGNQLTLTLSDSAATHTIPVICTILGTDFEDNLQYEHLSAFSNGTTTTYRHFKTVQNVLFQNLFGNTDTIVDGYASYALGGKAILTEASPLTPQLEEIVASVTAPDIIFRDYKKYDPIKTLDEVLTLALRNEFSVADLGIKIDVLENRTFTAGGSTSTIYGQKFRMRGNNIQKIQLLLALESGSTWSGTLSVGIRKLQTPDSFQSSSRFLPTKPIDFDPELETIAEVSLDQAAMLDVGAVLGVDHTPVDFVFSETSLAYPNRSDLVDGDWYMLTVRRTGSTLTGSIQVATSLYSGSTGFNSVLTEEESSGLGGGGGRISVFTNGIWTDVANRAAYYVVSGCTARASHGVLVDGGRRAEARKTDKNSLNQEVQVVERSNGFADTSTGVANYLIAKTASVLSEEEVAPKLGDLVASRAQDAVALYTLTYSEVEDLYQTSPTLVPVAILTDKNPRANPTITGTIYYPGLFSGNILDIPNPPTDLFTKSTVGSVITPNTNNPALRYRIVSQELVLDGYGDLNSDGVLNWDDLNAVVDLDGYDIGLQTTGSFTRAQQIALIKSREITAIDLLKANLTTDSLITISDTAALNAAILSGTAFPNGQSSFYRVRLTVEALSNQRDYIASDGSSTLKIESFDTALLSTFGPPVTWSIAPVRVWRPELVEVSDIRRFTVGTAVAFSPEDLTASIPTAGKNDLIIPGDFYMSGDMLDRVGNPYSIDFERAQIELELPDGSSEKEINIFDTFVKNKMYFADGSLVTSQALANSQVFFEVSVSSFAKNAGFGVDGYVDYSDVGEDADEAVGTYIDQGSGLMRVRAYNIVNNDVRPEVRTRIYVVVNLKRAGWKNLPRVVSDTELSALWT
jgi:hypothetical protein